MMDYINYSTFYTGFLQKCILRCKLTFPSTVQATSKGMEKAIYSQVKQRRLQEALKPRPTPLALACVPPSLLTIRL